MRPTGKPKFERSGATSPGASARDARDVVIQHEQRAGGGREADRAGVVPARERHRPRQEAPGDQGRHQPARREGHAARGARHALRHEHRLERARLLTERDLAEAGLGERRVEDVVVAALRRQLRGAGRTGVPCEQRIDPVEHGALVIRELEVHFKNPSEARASAQRSG